MWSIQIISNCGGVASKYRCTSCTCSVCVPISFCFVPRKRKEERRLPTSCSPRLYFPSRRERIDRESRRMQEPIWDEALISCFRVLAIFIGPPRLNLLYPKGVFWAVKLNGWSWKTIKQLDPNRTSIREDRKVIPLPSRRETERKKSCRQKEKNY